MAVTTRPAPPHAPPAILAEDPRTPPPSPGRGTWTLALVSIVLFMVALDNLVVTTALPSIRVALGTTVDGLEWTVNAYTLSFAVLLMTGAALGDRFGRRRMLLIGLGIFTAASATAALAPSSGALIAARTIQGAGAAIVMPLTLTLLSEAFPAGRRGVALGIWSGISGLGVALGPVIGGAVVSGISWKWIFWINVPVGLLVIPLSRWQLRESHGQPRRLDLAGILVASAGLLAMVFGLVRSSTLGWTSAEVIVCLIAGIGLLAAFVAWELRTPAPMLPMRFFRSRAFAATNTVSLVMYFGMFGSIFLLAQFLQTAQGYTPLQAGLRTLPWTAMPIFISPLAGVLSDRLGPRPLMFAGMLLQAVALALLSVLASPTLPYPELVGPFVISGTGMALVFAPSANAILAAVSPAQAGQASGAANAIRELGGVLGIAVLASVFTSHGSYASAHAFTNGIQPALQVGAATLALGALAAIAIPATRISKPKPATSS